MRSPPAQPVTQPPVTRRSLAGDLLGTAGVTIATTLASLAAVALLARVLPRDDFLAYTLLVRYLSLAIVMLSVGAGFAFIGYQRASDQESSVAPLLLTVLRGSLLAGFVPWLLVSIWLTSRGGIWPAWTVLGYLWVVAHTCFALVGPVARARGGVGGYVRLAIGSRTMPHLVGAALVLATGDFMALLVGFGVCSLVWQYVCWKEVSSPSLSAARLREAVPLLRFGITRWLDDLVRMAMPVALVAATGVVLGSIVAAVVALVYLIAKALESMLQPLVVAVMMRGRANRVPLIRDLGRVAAFTLLLTVALVVGRPIVELLFLMFLGDTYRDLVGTAWLMLIAAAPIIGVSYLRACYDNRFAFSPVFVINVISLLVMMVAVLWCNTANQVVMAAVLVHFGRLLTYAATLLVLGEGPADVIEDGGRDG